MVDQLSSFASEVTRVAREVGSEGILGGQARVEGVSGHLEGPDRVGELHGRQPHLAGEEHRRGDDRGGGGRPLEEDHGGREGRDRRAQEHHQHDGGPAALVRLRGDARGAGSGNRRQARRPGRRAGRRRHVEGPDRVGELHGRQPHLAGEEHRRGDDGGGGGRPLEEDHGGREGRDSGAQEHHQHDGGPAALVRRGGDARGAGSRNRRQARRPGRRAGRGRHVAGPHRLGELHGRQPHLAGAQHRRRDQGGAGGRPLAQDHGGREGRDPGAQEHHQHDGGPALVVRIGSDAGGARGGYRRKTRRPGRGARRVGRVEGPHRQRELHGRQPHVAGARHREGGDRGGERRPQAEAHGGGEGRDRGACRDHQHA